MGQIDCEGMANFISDDLRLKTFPLSVNFLKTAEEFPKETRQPSIALNKRITICQGVTIARENGWTVGLTKKDLICFPPMIDFGFKNSSKPAEPLCHLFDEIKLASNKKNARKELSATNLAKAGSFEAILLAPLSKSLVEPDTAVFYGNPAQVMRMIQALGHNDGVRITGNFGNKVECTEYLMAPVLNDVPQVVLPGNGDRIFSKTQDDEMVFSIPGRYLSSLFEGLKNAEQAIKAKYPVEFYQNFQGKWF